MNEALRGIGVAETELPTEAVYRRALKDFDAATSSDDAGQRLKAAIKDQDGVGSSIELTFLS
jgi:hypothetical protein